jgi:hypothetical protein
LWFSVNSWFVSYSYPNPVASGLRNLAQPELRTGITEEFRLEFGVSDVFEREEDTQSGG